MKPINIISAYQSIKAAYDQNINVADIKYDFKLKKNEIESLQKFINILKDNCADFNCFNGYYIGYEINQISKEFDLLRFNNELVINIELKGSLDKEIKIEKITKQMIENFYYLKFLSKKILIYTYVEDDGLYMYDDNNKIAVAITPIEIINHLEKQNVNYSINPDNLFIPSNYLISPFHNTNNFLNGEYFLTDHQAIIKKDIMGCITNREYKLFCISANAGTGKTLLMFDIAKTLSANGNKVRIIHCGKLNEGHGRLIDYGWQIAPIKNINMETVEFINIYNTNVFIIDEAQRIRQHQLDLIVEKSIELKIPIVFSYDVKQYLSEGENKDIYECISKEPLRFQVKKYKLSNKIRSNKEMASFIKNLIHIGDSNNYLNYENITIEYFEDKDDVTKYIQDLQSIDGWKAITFTSSRFKLEPLDEIAYVCDTKAHDVIGQEFKKVVLVMDSNFQYNAQGTLMTTANYYSAKGMLYQIVTRAVDELKIIVLNNSNLFFKLMQLKN